MRRKLLRSVRRRFSAATLPRGVGADVRAEDRGWETRRDLERLIQENPKFHLFEGELISSWSVHPDTLRFLYSLLAPGMSTLETGCGQTTVVFAIAGANHTCVMPDAGEAERVQQYCTEMGFGNTVRFVIESSDRALPRSDLIPSDLDFVLIDGAHGFPMPVVDWHYTTPRLKVGGILGIDDYKMPSVKILYDFICVEENWQLVAIVQNTAFFRKLKEAKDLVDWTSQRINASYPGY